MKTRIVTENNSSFCINFKKMLNLSFRRGDKNMIFRTDLALERREIYKKANAIEDEIDGIECSEEKVNDRVSITRVNIQNENGEYALGKPMGEYITLDISKVKYMEEESIEKISTILSNEIKKLVDKHIGSEDPVLVVGLGNEYVTPDALGPKVASDIEVTRHIIKYCPQFVKEGTREISAVSPGVLRSNRNRNFRNC